MKIKNLYFVFRDVHDEPAYKTVHELSFNSLKINRLSNSRKAKILIHSNILSGFVSIASNSNLISAAATLTAGVLMVETAIGMGRSIATGAEIERRKAALNLNH